MSRTAFFGVMLCAAHSCMSQLHAPAIGGEGNPASYEEKVFMPIAGIESSVMSYEDSLRFIPAYSIYRDWNTQSIFGSAWGKARSSDTTSLVLGYEPCDHFVPVCGALTSKFGMRRGRPHKGVDIDLNVGDPVVSAFDGMVRISRYSRSFGHVVVVRHGNGLESLYAHLSKRKVKPGDRVEAGQVIGLGGNTGRSSGAHLHFELRYLGQAIDPAKVFDLKEGELRKDKLHFLRGKMVNELPKIQASTGTSTNNVEKELIHVVRKGDTLYGLGRRYGTSVDALCTINRINKASKLRIGQKLKIQ